MTGRGSCDDLILSVTMKRGLTRKKCGVFRVKKWKFHRSITPRASLHGNWRPQSKNSEHSITFINCLRLISQGDHAANNQDAHFINLERNKMCALGNIILTGGTEFLYHD
jgi:hypothetical protein